MEGTCSRRILTFGCKCACMHGVTHEIHPPEEEARARTQSSEGSDKRLSQRMPLSAANRGCLGMTRMLQASRKPSDRSLLTSTRLAAIIQRKHEKRDIYDPVLLCTFVFPRSSGQFLELSSALPVHDTICISWTTGRRGGAQARWSDRGTRYHRAYPPETLTVSNDMIAVSECGAAVAGQGNS